VSRSLVLCHGSHEKFLSSYQATSHVVERDEIVTVTLILACIVFWQAQEISRAFSQCDPANISPQECHLGAFDACWNLQLVQRRLRYRRSERGYGAARRIELPGIFAAYRQPEEIPFKSR
jgi:hypothetical protein